MRFYLETDHPIAEDSPDHIQPRSTKLDNSTNRKFNERLLHLYKNKKPSVLDFGCAGGGMVRTLIDDGCVAVGLEGSDYNLKHQRAEWAVIPDNLFTCDLSYPFTLHTGDKQPYKFDVITAWEFVEHLPEERLPQMVENMWRHLNLNGLIIGSTTSLNSIYDGVEHHQTLKPMWWWSDLFAEYGFRRQVDKESYFDVADAWVRKVRFNFVFRYG
jgi:2-polyprenyl-3-methyl-5-hydroxy-6-metoxy-1,4-benzoquinol methylase